MLRNKKTLLIIYSDELEMDDRLNKKNIYIPKLESLLEWHLYFKWANWPYSIMYLLLTVLTGSGWTVYREFAFKKNLKKQESIYKTNLENKKQAFKKALADKDLSFEKIRIAYKRTEKNLKNQIDKQRKLASENKPCPDLSDLSEVKLYIKKQ